MSRDSPWFGRANAEIYDRFAREGSIYPALNRQLAELAELRPARRVLDLACGAGATALACLARLPARSELVGVDGSAAMVAVARERVRDPRARFEVAPAARVEQVVARPFDRTVSNAAFWQFPARPPVLAALARLLDPGGLLVFNVPAERLAGEPSEVHPYQVALARAAAHGPGRETATAPHRIAAGRIERQLADAGFTLLERRRFVHRGPQSELMELAEIPAMIARIAPGASPAEREEILAEARRHADPEQPVEVAWVYFVARRGAAAPSSSESSSG